MKYTSILLLLALLLPGDPLAAQTFINVVASRGLRSPLFATTHPGSDDTLFYLEQGGGRVKLLDLSGGGLGQIVEEEFVRVNQLATGGERGLLGMAFHPNYLENGKFYLYASRTGGRQDHQSHVLEYVAEGDPATATRADPDSARLLLSFDQPFGNHNGGWIGFDPTATGDASSYLYIATGDGGSGGDPQNNSQDITNNLLGKLLRIDVDGDDFPTDEERNYSIPPSNPFVDREGDDEIWAYGLRNPWRNSFDRETGDLWIGDVGQGDREEINLIPAGSAGGQNFGWRVMEGNLCFRAGTTQDGNLPCHDPSFAPPVYDYAHGAGEFEGSSVTGGYLYRGPLKEFQGHYFFTDFMSDHVWTLDPHSGEVTNRNDELLLNGNSVLKSLASFAEDNQANLYLVNWSGAIYRVNSRSRDAHWLGSTASGVPGDGTTWDDQNNWIRDGQADVGFISGDHLVIAANASGPLQSATDRRISALTLEAGADLTVQGQLDVVSGNITVPAEATARLTAEELTGRGSIRRLGEGRLELELLGEAEDGHYALLAGTTAFVGRGGKLDVGVHEGATFERKKVGGDQPLALAEFMAKAGSTVRLFPRISDADTTQPLSTRALLTVEQLGLTGAIVETAFPSGFEFPELDGGVESFPLAWAESAQIDGTFQALVNGNPAGHLGGGNFVSVEVLDQGSEGRTLSLIAYNAMPGDSNGDRVVAFEDFLVISDFFNQEGGWEEGDFTLDGRVTFADFLILSNNFGLSADAAAVAGVPEPNSLAGGLLLLATLGLVGRRKRWRHGT